MFKLAEEERGCGNNPRIVFVDDEFLRKSVANRAEWNDRRLDLSVVFGSGTSKSWKPLKHVYCQPVQVVTALVEFPSCEGQRQSKRRSGGITHCLFLGYTSLIVFKNFPESVQC